MKKNKTVIQEYKEKFDVLNVAFQIGSACIMDCIERSTGEHVAIICIANKEGNDITFTPLAQFLNSNPLDKFVNPVDPEYKVLDKFGSKPLKSRLYPWTINKERI